MENTPLHRLSGTTCDDSNVVSGIADILVKAGADLSAQDKKVRWQGCIISGGVTITGLDSYAMLL
jgi:hypothetical protein